MKIKSSILKKIKKGGKKISAITELYLIRILQKCKETIIFKNYYDDDSTKHNFYIEYSL